MIYTCCNQYLGTEIVVETRIYVRFLILSLILLETSPKPERVQQWTTGRLTYFIVITKRVDEKIFKRENERQTGYDNNVTTTRLERVTDSTETIIISMSIGCIGVYYEYSKVSCKIVEKFLVISCNRRVSCNAEFKSNLKKHAL